MSDTNQNSGISADTLAAALAKVLENQAPKAIASPNSYFVGIRNISSETIGLPKELGDDEISLNAPVHGVDDPSATAVVTYPHWQKLRKMPIFANGLLVRDDSVLGPVHTVAPQDRPQDLHPDHAKNALPDPVKFIEESNERELRRRIGGMTSEATLRRVLATVDKKVKELQGPGRLATDAANYAESQRRVEEAINNVPMAYQLADTLAQARLKQLDELDFSGPVFHDPPAR